MYDNEFFVIDMSTCLTTGEIINSLSLALETLSDSGKKIVLKLNESSLNQSQMLSIQSLVSSYGCILDTIETLNESTRIIAENMNITVQAPIENRIEEKIDEKPQETQLYSFENESKKQDEIKLKEIDGNRFEADLGAIQKQQENINIVSDLKEAGINPEEDFQEIENKISAQYTKPEEVVKTVEEMAKLNSVFSNEKIDVNSIKEEIITDENNIKEEDNNLKEENNNDDFFNAEKKSINVYKKAYDENKVSEEQWDEVDFYETPVNEPIVSDTKSTTYINQTLRSGQILEADGNVVIIGDCHPGSEIKAVGDITVWGILAGIAHAGCKGNTNARVRALKLNAVQLRIGNCYSRRPDGNNIPYIIRSSIFTPEEARVVDNEVVLFKINQN